MAEQPALSAELEAEIHAFMREPTFIRQPDGFAEVNPRLTGIMKRLACEGLLVS